MNLSYTGILFAAKVIVVETAYCLNSIRVSFVFLYSKNRQKCVSIYIKRDL